MSPFVRSKPFDPQHHDPAGFDCGVEHYGDWLRRHAAEASKRGSAKTFVWTQQGNVVGYYTLSAHAFGRDDLIATMQKGELAVIPAYLLGKFALDLSLRGGDNGRFLLLDAVTRAVESSEIGAAARLLVLDAENPKLVEFYRKFGFHLALNSSIVMYMQLSRIAKTLQALAT